MAFCNCATSTAKVKENVTSCRQVKSLAALQVVCGGKRGNVSARILIGHFSKMRRRMAGIRTSGNWSLPAIVLNRCRTRNLTSCLSSVSVGSQMGEFAWFSKSACQPTARRTAATKMGIKASIVFVRLTLRRRQTSCQPPPRTSRRHRLSTSVAGHPVRSSLTWRRLRKNEALSRSCKSTATRQS